ncbi:UDP-N-acetylmuramate dehydrogenase [Campylobacter sp. MIT 21-1685]|uniref:UDP-N-acetylmuramate dehydrogenase n=1 Tax=unclassified Campylobacter TaxID=2593542 RepID=UPI00224B1598|nr:MULTISPECIES: UDP-N-acetylmuramate dehydrogenase [unclassified Campylobacter]MCX2682610.1 UDP-N-acetylmuramate dehydrogenase [Campylobacter sp. MIT 21-1684]MCX2750890.1 UDP-N-acetylmuramate dehydrogenase [Campylobacter sp. MIT 21-1682]MCX2807177.1 UDP-N-acetylmuramate dehydrogenase [Campylobacter sp. MIT 21-1685]
MKIDFKKYSSVKIGTEFEVEVLDSLCEFDGFIIGGANNLLISDAPKNLAILGQKFDFIELIEHLQDCMIVKIGCATRSKTLYHFAKQQNLSGFEFLTKIPGLLGGLLKMNAGLKDETISKHLLSICTSQGEIFKEDIAFSYRSCPLKMPFFWAKFKLEFGFDFSKDTLLQQLRDNQPKGASFGSIFKNPKNNFAARLIEAVGLKGFCKNDAMISHQHANFLINKRNATFEDALYLIELAKKRVFEEFGVGLEEEVIIL